MGKEEEEEEEEQNPNHTTNTASTWGTWEELLLACAVKRHGFKNWDLIAMEVQAKSCLPQILTTADVCQQKYHDLNRRFSATTTTMVAAAAVKEEGDEEEEERRKGEGKEKEGRRGGDSYFNNNNHNNNNHNYNNNEDVDDTSTRTPTTTTTSSAATTTSGGAGGGGHGEQAANIPWLEELRKLRVAELKQEVHRYDVSILSLQLKVKRLEEEREKSVNLQDNKIQIQIETKPPEPQRQQQQQQQQQQQPDLNEDRSDNHKSDDHRFLLKPCISPDESDRENRSVNESNSTASEEKGGAVKLLEVDTVQAASVQQATPAIEIGRDESYELDDSVTQLSNEAQSQSSASLGRKKRRRKERRMEVGGGGGGGDGFKGKEVLVQSEPLIGILELIRAHKHGSLFESRLETQETETYKNMVRQHMDVETLQTRLDQGFYTSELLFHRDLLLLFSNAVVFFPESSVESLAAQELRSLVLLELRKGSLKSDAVLEQPTSSIPPVITAEHEGSGSDSLLAKHNSSVPIVVCRKRSSMSAKPSTSSNLGQKNEQQQQGKDDKAVCAQKPPVVEQASLNMKSKEKPVTGVRSSRRSNKNFAKVTSTLGKRQSTSHRMKDTTVDKTESSKSERKKIVPSATDKKQSAAEFLKRLKKYPGEKLKKNSRVGEDGGGESKKDNSGKGDRGKETVSRKSSDRRQVKEESSPVRRSAAGPSKKVAEASKASSKRAREGGRKEAEDVVKRPRKRSRR